MAAFSLLLPGDLERRLGEEARHCGQPRSELIREALEELLRRREQERFMAGLVAAAEALASDASARACRPATGATAAGPGLTAANTVHPRVTTPSNKANAGSVLASRRLSDRA